MKRKSKPLFPYYAGFAVVFILWILAFYNVYFWALGQVLWYPFSSLMRFEPLVCTDKPWFATQYGSGLALLIWLSLIYLISGFLKKKQ